MRKNIGFLSLLLCVCLVTSALVACGGGTEKSTEQQEAVSFFDYVDTVKFNKNSGRVSVEATLKLHVDGDTTHFYVDSSVIPGGVLKARYLAINTPESTGQIEPWGKKASNFTRNALSNATSIILESDTETWDLDSTGDRHLVWVWYKTAEMTDYRNLNLEILQEGLALASNASDNSYGETCVKILSQALAHKLNVHSKEKDPDFFYGSAQPMTLKELKINIEDYKDTSVSFEGVVVRNSGNTAYIEEYDEETGMYFGIQVYYGFGLDYFGTEILNVGNRVLIVGSVQYYEAGGTYQISDIKYHSMRPDHEDNIKKLGEGFEASYTELNAKTLLDGKVTIDVTVIDDEGNESIVPKTFDYGFLAMHASASLKGLTIKSISTTDYEESSNKGALSIYCEAQDGTEVVVRTVVLRDAEGNLVTADAFPVGSEIDVCGVVDVYKNAYQIKVFSDKDITIVR